ncbi:MAG: HsdM family class I SAM-dependent methyltransferase [Promethearchaeota archaeon]
MHSWADGNRDDVQSLLDVGFQYAPNNKEQVYLIQKSSKGIDIEWIWNISKLESPNTLPFVHQKESLLIIVNISLNSVVADIQYVNSKIKIRVENNQNVRFLKSLTDYYRNADQKLNSNLIRTIFGRNSFFNLLALKIMEISKPNISKWKKIYSKLYDERILDENLYLSHKYLSYLLKLFILKQTEDQILSYTSFEEILDVIPLVGANHFLKTDLFHDVLLNTNLNEIFHLLIPKLDFEQIDLFAEIFQELIALETRHPLGEVYTPRSLIQLMIKNKVTEQSSFLDPSCGTGSFLIELTLHLAEEKQLNRNISIYGIDINPLSILATLTNFILLLRNIDEEKQPEIHLINADALLIDNKNDNSNIDSDLSRLKTRKVDFIIGNPPWINISGIYRRDYKENLKSLARKMHILFNAESKNTEISTIFFNHCRDLYLKTGGEIFLILPASVLNGRQHGYFRYFPGFKGIEVWRFTEDIFKIHNICLYALNSGHQEKSEDLQLVKKRLTLFSILFDILDDGQIVDTKQNDNLIPIYIKIEDNNEYPLVGKFNPVSQLPESLQGISPIKSPYYPKVKGGLRIVPRRWVVIMEKPPFGKNLTIHPDMGQQSKPQWANPPYTEREIESEYVHAFLKSQFLIPFSFVNIQYAFIPIQLTQKAIKERKVIKTEHLLPKSAKFYQLLDSEYKKRIKASASMKTLADNFTYNNRLLPTNVLLKKSQIMVVHNSIGSIVKSAIIREPILLDNSLYYILLDNIDEAYYLCGVLNSRVMTDLVQMVGSTGSRGSLRNIHKNPYNFGIPSYIGTKIQLDIAQYARDLELYVKDALFDVRESLELNFVALLQRKKFNKGPRTIQKSIFNDKTYQDLLVKLNSLVRDILLSEKFSREEI